MWFSVLFHNYIVSMQWIVGFYVIRMFFYLEHNINSRCSSLWPLFEVKIIADRFWATNIEKWRTLLIRHISINDKYKLSIENDCLMSLTYLTFLLIFVLIAFPHVLNVLFPCASNVLLFIFLYLATIHPLHFAYFK